jgi:hypothetical protein
VTSLGNLVSPRAPSVSADDGTRTRQDRKYAVIGASPRSPPESDDLLWYLHWWHPNCVSRGAGMTSGRSRMGVVILAGGTVVSLAMLSIELGRRLAVLHRKVRGQHEVRAAVVHAGLIWRALGCPAPCGTSRALYL